jgi:hypothetical protein
VGPLLEKSNLVKTELGLFTHPQHRRKKGYSFNDKIDASIRWFANETTHSVVSRDQAMR